MNAGHKHWVQEKCDLSKQLDGIQTSMRATRVCELEKENHVLMAEVDRLRQINDCVRKKMLTRKAENDADALLFQSKIAELEFERRRCLCMPGVYSQGGKFFARKPKDTWADLRYRSKLAHDALEHAVDCCKLVLCADSVDSGSYVEREVMQLLEILSSRHQGCALIRPFQAVHPASMKC